MPWLHRSAGLSTYGIYPAAVIPAQQICTVWLELLSYALTFTANNVLALLSTSSSQSFGCDKMQVMEFWFGDESRLIADDEEYTKERNAKWWGAGPPDQDFIDTQLASKELMEQAAK